jgi:prepilin-type N-terminal cleavage/methylation domain-containing protein
MITTIPSPTANVARAGRNTSGFTLVEVMVAATISIFVLTGVITTALFIARSAANIRNYTDMETQGRKMLEYFAEDTRQASAVTWAIGGNSVTLVVNTINVTYAYSPTALTLTRTLAGAPNVSVSNVNAFQFLAYTINGTQITNFSTAAACTTAGNSTKQIQISLAASRNRQTLTNTTSTVLSARFILRNKKVTA